SARSSNAPSSSVSEAGSGISDSGAPVLASAGAAPAAMGRSVKISRRSRAGFMAIPCGSRYWTAAAGRPKAAGPGFPGPQDSAQAAAGSELEVEVQVVLAAVGIERVRQLRVVAGLAVVLELGIVEVERVEGD